MAQQDRLGAANLHGLARVQRERRWTRIMDGVLVAGLLLWTTSLTTTDLLPAQARWVLPALMTAVLVHRLLVGLERRHRERTGLVAERRELADRAVRRGRPVSAPSGKHTAHAA